MVTGARQIRWLILFRRDHLPPRSDDPKTDVLQLFSGTSLLIPPWNPGGIGAPPLSSGDGS